MVTPRTTYYYRGWWCVARQKNVLEQHSAATCGAQIQLNTRHDETAQLCFIQDNIFQTHSILFCMLHWLCYEPRTDQSIHWLKVHQIVVWFPAWASNFPVLQSIQTGTGAHPISCLMSVKLTTHPHLVPSLRISRGIPLFPHIPSW
jgi:hypothetical protein